MSVSDYDSSRIESQRIESTPNPNGLEKSRGKLIGRFGLIVFALVSIDQLTKWWAFETMRPRILGSGSSGNIRIVGDLLQLTYAENTGAAFSFGSKFTWIFSLVAVIIFVSICIYLRRVQHLKWIIALGGIAAGALGNLLDRIYREPGLGQGYVVDFIALPNFPIFNVADITLTFSAIFIFYLAMRGVGVQKVDRSRNVDSRIVDRP